MATPAVSRSRKAGDGTSQPSSAWHDVLELCKKGFANKLEGLCDVLVTVVRNEMRQGAEKWRGEVMDQMSQREHQLDKSLLSLREKLDHMELKIMDPDRVDSPFLGGPLPPTSPGTPVVTELPLPGSPTHAPPLPTTPSQTLRTGSAQRMQVDELMPVIEHLRKSDTLHQAASAQLEEHLERVRERCEALGRVSTAVLNGVQRLEQQVQQLEHKSQVAEAKMSNVLGQQQSLNAVSSQVAKELQSLQQKDALAFSDLQGRLQSHATEMRSVVHDDVHGIQEDLSGIKEHQQKDFRTVVMEISRIQQVLHLDFVKVLHEEPCRKMISRARQAPRTSGNDLGGSQAKRFRDFFAQTEPPPQKEAHSQTEASLYLEVDFKPRKQRESKHSNQPMLEEAASQHFGGGEEHFKEKAREAAMKPPYSVYDFYHSTGCSQAIARSHWFEYVTLLIVFLNAAWMAVDMDLNTASVITEAHPAFLIVENAFCTYFFLELLVRFAAFERKCNCLRDGWFVLDLLLMLLRVGHMAGPDTCLCRRYPIRTRRGSMMTLLRMLRMAKLCRLTRLARLLRAVPELVIIVKGIGFASRSVTIFFMFWTLITYAFAIAIRELTENTEVGNLYFRTVPEAMNTLLLQGLFPESVQLLDSISGGATWYLWPLTVFFLALVSLTVMYMLVGVLVEVVQVVASVEKESLAVTFMSSEMRRQLMKLGWSPEQPISKSEFQRLVVERPIARIIHAVGVDVYVLCEMLDLIFEEVEREGLLGMPFNMLMDNILSLRGSNPAKVKDCLGQFKMFKIILHERHENLMKKLKREFDRIKADVTDVKEDVKEMREADVREKQMRLLQPPAPDDSD